MPKGKLVISIDLELAWGYWDCLTPEHLRMAETAERPICAALIELFDRFEVPATWAIVAALLDAGSPKSRPGSPACWHAPDIIERIRRAKVRHEIGSHSGKHVCFGEIAAAQAREDLDYMRALHHVNGLPHCSFVYPRNVVGHLDLVAQAGLRTFRGPDVGWVRSVGRASRIAARAANLADQILPIPPSPITAERCGTLVNLPGSMLLMGRNGARRFVLPTVSRAKLRAGLDRARRSSGIFHFWFHPSNFYYRTDEQVATLAWFLEHAISEARQGRIEICTMASFADDATGKASAEPAAGLN